MRAFLVALILASLVAGCAQEGEPTSDLVTTDPAPPAGTSPPAEEPVPPAPPAPEAAPPATPETRQQEHDATLRTGAPATIVAPEGWTLVTDLMGADFFVLAPREGPNDIFRENVNLMLQSAEGMTAEEYEELSIESVAELIENGRITSITSATLAGRDATRMDYEGRVNGVDLAFIGWWFLEDGIAYVFTYSAEPDKLEVELAEAIAASLTIGEPRASFSSSA